MYLGKNISRSHPCHSWVIGIHFSEEVLVVLGLDHMIVDVIRGPPSRFATLKAACVHPMIFLIPWIDVLRYVLKSDGGLPTFLQPLN